MLGASLNSLKHGRIPWEGGPLSLAHSLVHFPDTKWAHPTKVVRILTVPHILYLHIFICLFLDPSIFFWHKLRHRHQKKCMPSPQQHTSTAENRKSPPLDASVLQVASSAGVPPPPPLGRLAAARGQPRWRISFHWWLSQPLAKKNSGIKPKTGWRKNLRCLKHFETNQLS